MTHDPKTTEITEEVEALKHDIARHIQIAVDLTQDNELLRWKLEYASDALQEIADEPVDEIAVDPDWPRRIAKDALEKISG